ncbi:MAG: START domain-containing protein [Candidatus Scalindua sp.]|jgi:hypothetical protein|nr:START domain-containing protein [Candidatus Scalindua sp.]MDV5166314.1 START domain-containing protein [Candidatus Scalindua sp.]
MKYSILSLLVFLLVTLPTYSPLTAEEEEWQHIYESDGINICKRVAEGSKFFEFKAVGNLRGMMSEYVSAILDTNEHSDWAPRCLEARNVEKVNDQEFVIYAVYAGVWPTADRDYSARVSITAEPGIPTVRVDIERVELSDTLPVSADRVHIPHMKSCWIFEQISQNCTRVELCAHVDPGGWIPAWLVNWGYRTIPFQFLKNLEAQVDKRSNRTSTLARSSTIAH